LEILEGAQRGNALPVLRAHPLHRAAEEVREKEAVDEHRLRPRDRLLVARHEARPGGAQESLRRVGAHEVAGAEHIAHARRGAAPVDQAGELDDLAAEADELLALAVTGDVAELKRAPPASLVEQEPEVVPIVKAAVDEVDARAVPRERLLE